MPAPVWLGTLSASTDLVIWAARTLASRLPPEFFEQPLNLSRVGDLIVWNGNGGRKVIAALESLGETESHIQRAVEGLESSQHALQGTLGTLQSVSMATLGITSLSAVYMGWRLAALNRRLESLSRQISDVLGRIDAQDLAHLSSSQQFLRDFEAKQRPADLDRALAEAREAANIYGNLALEEANGPKRLSVLNYRTRCYQLGLMVELQCMLLREDGPQAVMRVERDEQPRLQRIAEVTFTETIGAAPESFLDPGLQSEGITLDLVTEIYRQAHQCGAIREGEYRNAGEMFEHLRPRIYNARRGLRWVWSPAGKAAKQMLAKLRYLMACLEDTNRIEALKLQIGEFLASGLSLSQLTTCIENWRKEHVPPEKAAGNREPAFAYTFA